MIQITPTIKLHTYQESMESGLHVRSLVLQYKNNNYHLHGGTRDTIFVFTEGVAIYVLTINTSIGYIGLNTYMAPESDPINSVFLQNSREIKETLGHKWEGLAPVTMVKRLMEHLF